MDSLNLAKTAAQGALDRKATRLVLLDMNSCSDVCEYKLICSGSNDKQTKAIAQSIEDMCARDFGVKPITVEGKQNGHWILLDYGATIVHVFYDYVRDFYALEQLWDSATMIDYQ